MNSLKLLQIEKSSERDINKGCLYIDYDGSEDCAFIEVCRISDTDDNGDVICIVSDICNIDNSAECLIIDTCDIDNAGDCLTEDICMTDNCVDGCIAELCECPTDVPCDNTEVCTKCEYGGE